MKPLFTLCLATILFAGCATPVAVTLHNATDGKPIADALVQRNRKPNWCERLINPVGAFYHEYWTVETVVTDEKGRATIKRIKAEDEYDVVVDQQIPVTATFGDNVITLQPCEAALPAYHYRIRPHDGWAYFVQKPWFNVEHQKAQCKP